MPEVRTKVQLWFLYINITFTSNGRRTLPESLATVEIEKVAYLSIDMNSPVPEVAALEHFWPKLVSGAVVVFDDYGFEIGQKEALDRLTAQWGVKIWLLPTGQGLLLKP